MITVTKDTSESSERLIRRFQQKVQLSGIVKRVKGSRYRKKSPNKRLRMKKALRRQEVKERIDLLLKMGKFDPTAKKTRNPLLRLRASIGKTKK